MKYQHERTLTALSDALILDRILSASERVSNCKCRVESDGHHLLYLALICLSDMGEDRFAVMMKDRNRSKVWYASTNVQMC